MTGMLIGFIQHMFLDFINNIKNPLAYFLWYRISVKFDTRKIWGLPKAENGRKLLLS
jgi:hypothetical protein